MTYRETYKGCTIQWDVSLDAYFWEDQHYGAESEDIFRTVTDAKADIDNFFLAATLATPEDIDAALAQRSLEAN